MGTTCRGRTEEGILATSMLSIVLWLLQCYQHYAGVTVDRDPLFSEIENKCVTLISTMLSSNFTMTMLYLAMHGDKGMVFFEKTS